MLQHLPLLRVEREGVHLHTRSIGSGSPLLLMHGHPQSMVMWHKVIPFLAKQHTLVMMDLRGYGDDGVPGIGNRPLASIRREEKTTPAGRYVSSLDLNLAGNQILWVDYESAISLHSLVTGDPKEQRAKRLASQSVEDNRISFGCINVSATFFQKVVMPTFKDTLGIVYILPDSRAIQEVFSFYEP